MSAPDQDDRIKADGCVPPLPHARGNPEAQPSSILLARPDGGAQRGTAPRSLAESARDGRLACMSLFLVLMGLVEVGNSGWLLLAQREQPGPAASMVQGVIFVVLGCLMMRHPARCALLGLGLYAVPELLMGINNPSALTASGIFFRMVLTTALIAIARAGIALEQARSQRASAESEPPRRDAGIVVVGPVNEHIQTPGTCAPGSLVPPAEVAEATLPDISAARSTAFFDRAIAEHRPRPVFVRYLLILSLLFLVPALACRIPEFFLIGSCGSVFFGLALLLARPRPLTVRFTVDGLQMGSLAPFLPYRCIYEVFAPGRDDAGARQFPIYLLCDRGHVILSPNLQAPSEELYRFLHSQPLGQRGMPILDQKISRTSCVSNAP
jgi:hypothetical protein